MEGFIAFTQFNFITFDSNYRILKALKGTGIAIITPFNAHQEVDFEALTQLTHYWISGGVDYLVVLGTTGESVTLSGEEKLAVLQTVVQANAGRVPLVYGLGGNNTGEIVRQMKAFNQPDVVAFLSVTPYYNKPGQEGLKAHYSALAEASPLPILLYNVPGRTGIHMMPETTLWLAEKYDNIVGVKEACGQMEPIMEIIRSRRPYFLVISGDDALTLPLMAVGADGVISVIANAFPAITSQMVQAAKQGNWDVAKDLHYAQLPMIKGLFAENSPGGIKAVMAHLGLCNAAVRLPLVSVSSSLQASLVQEANRLRANHA
jgi:4-hydroxy-tetrahydrodipicolinate synthase